MMRTLFTVAAVALSLFTVQKAAATLPQPTASTEAFLQVSECEHERWFPLSAAGTTATICTDANDHTVVSIAAKMLSDDVALVTGQRPALASRLPEGAAVVAGTLGRSRLVTTLAKACGLDVGWLKGKWEAFLVATTQHPQTHAPLLLVVGSDRRGTAFGLTSLSEAIGVSPWYWWADVTPMPRAALYVEPGTFRQPEPSVQYRGIFINDERFGGWARWAEQTYDKATGKVGPKTYRRVFELLLRLKANYLWPAMHPGTQAFNDDPANARLADDYAIVMGSSHCEQMLRNNEGEWKKVGTYGDFNYITNRKRMQDYWEERVKTNGKYENTYTLGLRGIHDYPMEGANTTEERVRLMQQAIDDQRAMLRRNIKKPLEEIPQVLCTYEEVLEAYHNGLRVPDDVTLLWSDDKHGYCRNLSNPQEQRRSGGAGIYYHLSYHGDPASWIWLSPLSPAFLATELTKAYDYGARKIWVFNVGDIKPAEKELSFVMELAWNVGRWLPTQAHGYMAYWAAKTFGQAVADDIARLLKAYYRLQAAGKDAHVWFVDYTEQQLAERLSLCRSLEVEAELLASRLPPRLQDAYFELVSYPVRGAALLNEYQLLARRSMACATRLDSLGAMADAHRVRMVFDELNAWTRHYNEEVRQGKWREFFSWQPYHWYRSEQIEVPIATPELLAQARHAPQARRLSVGDALSPGGVVVESNYDVDVPLWMKALTPIRNFSKARQDNVFCRVNLHSSEAKALPAEIPPDTGTTTQTFEAAAAPINNVWHAPFVGPMWSQVGVLHLRKGVNRLTIADVKADARIDEVFLGLWPPFSPEPRLRIEASACQQTHDSQDGRVTRVEGLGYTDGLMVQPLLTPSYEPSEAPSIDYLVELCEGDSEIEIRTLPTLQVYEGRRAATVNKDGTARADLTTAARYAVQLGEGEPQLFSIHTDDFSPEWRLNVLRGFASRTIAVPHGLCGRHRLRISLLDPGIVVQEILVR